MNQENDVEETVFMTELEMTVTTPVLGTEGIKEFHFRATSTDAKTTLRMMEKAVKEYAVHLRSLK